MGGICFKRENCVIHHVSDYRPIKKNAHTYKQREKGEIWCQAGGTKSRSLYIHSM